MMNTVPCERYFQEFLPRFLGRRLLKDVERLNACVDVDLEDLDMAPWRLRIESGQLVEVSHEGPPPVCVFSLDSETMLKIVSGRYAPETAFFEMRVHIGGDVETALKLSTVLGPFFQLFPYSPQV